VKIEQIETTLLEMPYKKPLITATNKFAIARGVLVKASTDNGIEGYGYADLFPRTGETPETARHVIDGVLRPKVIGRELEELARIRAEIEHTLIGNPRAKAALEIALYDALAKSAHAPLYLMLGGCYRATSKSSKWLVSMIPRQWPTKPRRLRVVGSR
jgi:L-Ala-D/L-Glu epimerase